MSKRPAIPVSAWLIAAAGFLSLSASIAVGRPGTSRGLELTQIPATYSVSGRVFDAVTGQPIAGIRFVYGRPAETANNGGFTNFAFGRTNDVGEFSLKDLKPAHYVLYVGPSLNQSDQYSDPVAFDLVDADVVNLEVPVHHGSRLSGFVVPAGVTNPAALSALSSVKLLAAVPGIGNLRVGIVNFSAIGPDGSFQLVGLRPGKAIINLKADSEGLNGLSIMRIERGGVEQSKASRSRPATILRICRYSLPMVRASFVAKSRSKEALCPPVRVFWHRLQISYASQMAMPRSDPEGKFVISGLAAGTYEITLNTYRPPPHQGVRMLPTLKQSVKVSDVGDSPVLFTIFLEPPKQKQ